MGRLPLCYLTLLSSFFISSLFTGLTGLAVVSGAQANADSDHKIALGGTRLRYHVHAGFLPVNDPSGKPAGSLFYRSYTRIADQGAAPRPVTFIFNGGPGAATTSLEIGAFGPRRLNLGPEGLGPPPGPIRFVDNSDTLLGQSDLVFIDELNTGYGRSAPGVDANRFYTTSADAGLFTQAIAGYLRKNHRESSPTYLAGESYGTLRAVLVADQLRKRYGIDLDGLVLLSPYLRGDYYDGTETPARVALAIPSYTAMAAYHHLLSPSTLAGLGDAIKASEKFAIDAFLPEMSRMTPLSVQDRRRLLEKFESLTGLSGAAIPSLLPDFQPWKVREAMLPCRVGMYDDRLVEPREPDSEKSPDAKVFGHYIDEMPGYLASFVKFRSRKRYLPSISPDWNFECGSPGCYPNAMPVLAALLKASRRTKVLVATGYYDLRTPFFVADYSFQESGLSKDPERVRIRHYPGGHLMYSNPNALAKLHADLADLYERP